MNYFVAFSGVYQDKIGKYACFLNWKCNLKGAQNIAQNYIDHGYKNVTIFACEKLPECITWDFINKHKIKI